MASRQLFARRGSISHAGVRTSLPIPFFSSVKTVAVGSRSYKQEATSQNGKYKPLPGRPSSYQKAKNLRAQPINAIPDLEKKFDLAGFHNSLEWLQFHSRHIGPRNDEVDQMLKVVGAQSLDDFVSQVIPKDVMLPPPEIQSHEVTERKVANIFDAFMEKNETRGWFIGNGYYPVVVPPVIKRNILENPGWYTSYTPYQPEISQGRLESLLNFQTMVSDLTGLPIANSSLLDEGTAAAEAMTMSMNSVPASRLKRENKTYLVSHLVHSRTFQVMRGRAEGFGIRLQSINLGAADALDKVKGFGDDLIGVMVQYPDTEGGVHDYRKLADVVHEQGVLLSAATDLMALTLLTPPGEWGADIAFGNSQRFGVPMGFGGPHAAFMAVKEASKRRLPGRLIGVSKDRQGRHALRLALQTREQHIRREKATSNVCTAQALLANMAAMFAIYHGPGQLKAMAAQAVSIARSLQKVAQHYGIKVKTSTTDTEGRVVSDTITFQFDSKKDASDYFTNLDKLGFRTRLNKNASVTIAISAGTTPLTFTRFSEGLQSFATQNGKDSFVDVGAKIWEETVKETPEQYLPGNVQRTSAYLTHPVFNSHHSETEMLRYIHHLQSKDLSLVHSMIPLGSCTMKLNATSQMELITHPKLSNVHPDFPLGNLGGINHMIKQLTRQLTALTGMDDTSLQPNSGAQGEFAGLRAIHKYHQAKGGNKRDICLIPTSAHGTNPASAAMAGMRVVPIKCDVKTGNLDLADLQAKCEKHADELAAIMITYPSTYGVFEPDVRKACDLVHQHGGQVYMDGANMNAQIGLTSPGTIGADVCHLNLHKTFCIPHGGGGPGVGPICVKKHLAPYLPHASGQAPVASAAYGSASILPISWAYISTMADKGLRRATEVALLNANYLLNRLKDHFPILYTNDKGRCAHEFIIDARPFKDSAGIEVIDIAKRLQDYGFHSPTMSWPVPGTLMVEPTESESKEELDRFADAMISIRNEIREVEEGKQPRAGNVLKNSPHSQIDIIIGDGEGKWDRPYSREKAAYPLPYLLEKKFWPSVGRVDDTFGDTNLFCTCPPVEDTTGQ